MELDDQLYAQIVTLSEKADALVENDEFDRAITEYQRAVSLLPDPKMDWEASTWLYASIGDTYFFMEDYKQAAGNLYNALNGPGGNENAFIYLRLGESLYELGELKQAREFLLKAY